MAVPGFFLSFMPGEIFVTIIETFFFHQTSIVNVYDTTL